MTDRSDIAGDDDSILKVEFTPAAARQFGKHVIGYGVYLGITQDPPLLRVVYVSGRVQEFVGRQALDLLPWARQQWLRERRATWGSERLEQRPCWVVWSTRRQGELPELAKPAALL